MQNPLLDTAVIGRLQHSNMMLSWHCIYHRHSSEPLFRERNRQHYVNSGEVFPSTF